MITFIRNFLRPKDDIRINKVVEIIIERLFNGIFFLESRGEDFFTVYQDNFEK